VSECVHVYALRDFFKSRLAAEGAVEAIMCSANVTSHVCERERVRVCVCMCMCMRA
jgi:hypothetical protein